MDKSIDSSPYTRKGRCYYFDVACFCFHLDNASLLCRCFHNVWITFCLYLANALFTVLVFSHERYLCFCYLHICSLFFEPPKWCQKICNLSPRCNVPHMDLVGLHFIDSGNQSIWQISKTKCKQAGFKVVYTVQILNIC